MLSPPSGYLPPLPFLLFELTRFLSSLAFSSTSILLFDTMFHQTLTKEVYTYAVPKLDESQKTPVPLRKVSDLFKPRRFFSRVLSLTCNALFPVRVPRPLLRLRPSLSRNTPQERQEGARRRRLSSRIRRICLSNRERTKRRHFDGFDSSRRNHRRNSLWNHRSYAHLPSHSRLLDERWTRWSRSVES